MYGAGAFVNNLLGAASGGMMIVLNLGLGMNPGLVGLLGALPRLTDALTDPMMGFISDRTTSRWGRRRPYIFGGAIAAGLIFALLWQLPENKSESFYFWYFLAGSLIFFLAFLLFRQEISGLLNIDIRYMGYFIAILCLDALVIITQPWLHAPQAVQASEGA